MVALCVLFALKSWAMMTPTEKCRYAAVARWTRYRELCEAGQKPDVHSYWRDRGPIARKKHARKMALARWRKKSPDAQKTS
jgi:hypothetical protein